SGYSYTSLDEGIWRKVGKALQDLDYDPAEQAMVIIPEGVEETRHPYFIDLIHKAYHTGAMCARNPTLENSSPPTADGKHARQPECIALLWLYYNMGLQYEQRRQFLNQKETQVAVETARPEKKKAPRVADPIKFDGNRNNFDTFTSLSRNLRPLDTLSVVPLALWFPNLSRGFAG